MAMEDRDDQTVLGVISLLSLLNYLVQNMAAARAPGEEEEGGGGGGGEEGEGDGRGVDADATGVAAASSASSLFDASLRELGICGGGAQRDAEATSTAPTAAAADGHAVASDATLIDVLRLMLEHKISAVPVRNDAGAIDSVFSCDDVMFLMHVEQLQLQHLELPIREVIDYCTKVECFEGLHTCSLDDSLASVVEKFVEAQVRRIALCFALRNPAPPPPPPHPRTRRASRRASCMRDGSTANGTSRTRIRRRRRTAS
jgi:hypothetical protein